MKMRTMLNLKEGKKSIRSVSGEKLPLPELLFQKIEDDTIQKQIDKLHQSAPVSKEYPAVKPDVSFEEFSKQDLRIGKILTAEKVKGADKLLQLSVDLGFEKRTIVSGIAEFFKPEEIIGKQVSVVVNLAPRKIKGILSQGMVLMAEDSDGKLTFISPSGETSPGSVIR